jgi:hypothetical protein
MDRTVEKEEDEFLFATAAEVDNLSLECPPMKKSAAVAHFARAPATTAMMVGCMVVLSASFL